MTNLAACVRQSAFPSSPPEWVFLERSVEEYVESSNTTQRVQSNTESNHALVKAGRIGQNGQISFLFGVHPFAVALGL